jgi:hypothetical protein
MQAASELFPSFFGSLGAVWGVLIRLSLSLCVAFLCDKLLVCSPQKNRGAGISTTRRRAHEQALSEVPAPRSFVSALPVASTWNFGKKWCQPASRKKKSFFALQALRQPCHATANVHGSLKMSSHELNGHCGQNYL